MNPKEYGTVIAVQGQVVEVHFPTTKLAIFDVLTSVENTGTVLEVHSSSGKETFFCLALSSVETLYRGTKLINTKKQLTFPVGKELLGRAVDVFGNAQDDLGSITPSEHWPIH